MKVPTFQRQQFVDNEGFPTSQTQQFMDVLTQQMQRSVSDDGFVIPSQSLDSIQNIVSPDNPNAKGDGTIWYDSTNARWLGLKDGVLVQFTTTPA